MVGCQLYGLCSNRRIKGLCGHQGAPSNWYAGPVCHRTNDSDFVGGHNRPPNSKAMHQLQESQWEENGWKALLPPEQQMFPTRPVWKVCEMVLSRTCVEDLNEAGSIKETNFEGDAWLSMQKEEQTWWRLSSPRDINSWPDRNGLVQMAPANWLTCMPNQ